MVASTIIPLNKKQQASFIAYYKSIQSLMNVTRNNFRSRMERIDREYQREVDLTEEQARAKAANRAGDITRVQNIVIPIIMPQVEAAVVHQTSVFLTGQPLFAVVSSPTFIDEALQLETKVDNESIKGGWARELMLGFRDGFKYDFAFMEVDWVQEVTYSIETNLKKDLKTGTPKEVLWSGNRVRRLDPYNTFVDTRVPIAKIHEQGEFAGYTEFYSKIRLKALIAALPDKIIANVVPAFESGLGGALTAQSAGAMNFYVPNINPDIAGQELTKSLNWMNWAGLETTRSTRIDYKNGYEVTTVYCRILPSEFGLRVPNNNTPQIYKLIIVNHEWIIYAELQTNAHNFLPILGMQPHEDGLNYQTKSLADNAAPFQQVTSAYMTSIISSRKRAISDRVLYDPSRVTSSAINSSNPSAKIPVRPSAQGGKLADAVYAFPYREDQAANSMQQIQSLIGLANTLNGQNQVTQGQFVKGNRTLQEFESVMTNANGRDQLVSILIEHQLFTPMKLMLKLNILQFQGGTTIFNRDKDISVEIDPIALRKAVIEFKVADGLIPSSKLLNSDSFATALQVFGSSPQIAASYNVGQLFSYFMKTQGAKISEFEKSTEQVAFEQAVSQWQQLTMAAIDKGIQQEQLPPQPVPADFNYNPAANRPTPAEATT